MSQSDNAEIPAFAGMTVYNCMTMVQPNILLITSDQQRGDCYGFAGRKVQTPHLDRLAAESAHFRNCIAASPVCQPSRASILTGQLPLTHGVCDNGIDLQPQTADEGFAAVLARAGYDTAIIGKAHFSTCQTFAPTGTPECKTSSANFGDDWHGPYMGFSFADLMALGHWHKTRPPILPPHGLHYEKWFFDKVGGDAFELWKSETRQGTGAAQTWHSALPVAWHTSTWATDRALHWLSSRDGKTPFCLWLSYPDPHHPFDCPPPWNLLHDPADIDLPKHRAKDLDARPWWHRASLEGEPQEDNPVFKRFRAKASRAADQSDAQLREMTANYYGMISLIDHNVGRVLSSPQLPADTIVIYTSDHGDLLGDHGLYLKGPTPYEGLINVGMLVRAPGVKGGMRIAAPVSTLDIAATMCDYAGAKLPDKAQSQTLRPLMENDSDDKNTTGGGSRDASKANPAGDASYCEWNLAAGRCGVELKLRTVHTGDAKLTMELNSGAGEMYDLVNDPHELCNIFDDPSANAQTLRKTLTALLKNRPGNTRQTFDAPVGMA